MISRLIIASLFVSGAFASEISYVDLFQTQAFTQTSNAQPLTGQYFLATRLYLGSAGDFNGATFTPAGGSSIGLTPDGAGTVYSYSTGLYATAAALNADFPTGTYSYTATDSTNNNPNAPQTVTVNYTSTSYPSATPYLTNYSGLVGMNPGSDFLVAWNSFTGALSNPNFAFVFFDISTTGGTNVYSQDFLTSNASSAVIAAGTLQANTQYNFDIIFSNRVITDYASGSATFPPQLGFDLRTDGSFTTGAVSAVPEPSTMVPLTSGLLLLGGGIIRRRRRSIHN